MNEYRKLQQHLDSLPIGFPPTQNGVEIRILKQLFTLDQVQIALSLSLLPKTTKQVIKQVRKQEHLPHLDDNAIRTELNKMGEKGAIMVGYKGDTPLYSNAMLAIGMFEFQGDFITKEFAQDMLHYMEEGFRDEFFENPPLQLRPLPAKSLLTPEFPVATYDDIRALIRNVSGHITVVNCICKLAQDKLGHPCQVTDERLWCMSFSYGKQSDPDKHPSFHQEKKILTKKEALAKIDMAEKAGLVLQPSNSQKPIFLCLCCGDCCGVLTEAKKLPAPAQYFHSNYQINFNPTLCISCKRCISRCQMEAISWSKSHIQINIDSCIGCGLCVSECKQNALSLIPKPTSFIPPKTTTRLYLKILEGKMGRMKAYKMLLKLFFEKFM